MSRIVQKQKQAHKYLEQSVRNKKKNILRFGYIHGKNISYQFTRLH